MPELFFWSNPPALKGKTTGQLAGDSARDLHKQYDAALGELADIDREFRATRARLDGPLADGERASLIEKLRRLDSRFEGKKLEIERIAAELERKDPVFRQVRQERRDKIAEQKERKEAEERRQAEQARQQADRKRKDDFRRWLEDYDRRRFEAKRLQDREDFARSLDLNRLNNLEFLAHMGAIDKVGGIGAVATQRAGQTDKLEGRLRLIESPERRRARTDALALTRHATSRLDPAALEFLSSNR
ncbi:MAG: hypothetical protein FJZ01_15830 [Candidatus Sericytochromatia bacterium]|nr:hypothetical protein [Candidatus Tanganyikabacteria bacterium]